MTVAVVVHPGKVGGSAAARSRIEALVAEMGEPAPLWFETSADDPGPGQARAALAAGARLVLAWGGEGTVNGVATVLAHTGVSLGVLPGGSTNLLARNLGIPLDLPDALRTAYRGRDHRIDVLDADLGKGERRLCLVRCGAGFDAEMMAAPEAMKKRLKWGACAVAGARQIGRKPMRLAIGVDGRPAEELLGQTVLVANLGMLVAGMSLVPEAKADDGFLDVLVIDPSSPADWLHTAGAILLSRGSAGDPSQVRFRGQQAVVRTRHVRRRQVDGDLVSSGSDLRVSVLPRALVVRVPRRRTGP
jgi:diacylglycerol kinase family enzyme